MNNTIKVSDEQEVRLIELEGELGADLSSQLEELLSQQSSLESKKIIIDLEKVPVVTTDGVRVLINASISSESGRLSLINLNEDVNKLIKTIGLDALVEA